jgi:hypothetical protein
VVAVPKHPANRASIIPKREYWVKGFQYIEDQNTPDQNPVHRMQLTSLPKKGESFSTLALKGAIIVEFTIIVASPKVASTQINISTK